MNRSPLLLLLAVALCAGALLWFWPDDPSRRIEEGVTGASTTTPSPPTDRSSGKPAPGDAGRQVPERRSIAARRAPPGPDDLIVEVRDQAGVALADFPLVLVHEDFVDADEEFAFATKTDAKGVAIFRAKRKMVATAEHTWCIAHDVTFEKRPRVVLDADVLARDRIVSVQPPFGAITIEVSEHDRPAQRVESITLAPVRPEEKDDPTLAWKRRRFTFEDERPIAEKTFEPEIDAANARHVHRGRFEYVELGRRWAVLAHRDGEELTTYFGAGTERPLDAPGPARQDEHVTLRAQIGRRYGKAVYRVVDASGRLFPRTKMNATITREFGSETDYVAETDEHSEIEVDSTDEAFFERSLTVEVQDGNTKLTGTVAIARRVEPGRHRQGDLVVKPPGILVSGIAVDTNGNPVPNHTVTAGRWVTYDNGFLIFENTMASTKTDASGRFAIRDTLPYTKFNVWADGSLRSDGVEAKPGDEVRLVCFRPCKASVAIVLSPGVTWDGTELQLFRTGSRLNPIGTQSASQDGDRIAVDFRPVRPGRYDLVWKFRGHQVGEKNRVDIRASGQIAEIDLRDVLFGYSIRLRNAAQEGSKLSGIVLWRDAGSDKPWRSFDIKDGAVRFSATSKRLHVRVVPIGGRAEERTIDAGKHEFVAREGYRIRLVLRTFGKLPEHPYIFDPAPHQSGKTVGKAVGSPYFTKTKREAVFLVPAGPIEVKWHLERRAKGSAIGGDVLGQHSVRIRVKESSAEQRFYLDLDTGALNRLVQKPPF